MRRAIPVALALFGVFSLVVVQLHTAQTASAAAANTVNFQARLQSASGAIVPDGNYNLEFKLYSASSGGSALWTEDYLNSSSAGLKTINGYLTANLGSITSFPSTINWDQQLWLTMNVGGTSTGSVSWDGEMSPRLSLTAVPFSFSAGQLSITNGSGHSSLTIQGSTSGDQSFVIQDQGAAGTYNLLTTNRANAGYIQLQGSTPGTAQTGNFNISGSGVAGVLQGSTAIKTPAIRPITDSTSALQVQNAAGTVNILTVDTTNDRIGIGTVTPGASLSIKGAGADSSTIALDVENSAGGALITARNDGQVTIGTTAASGTSTTFGSMANTTPDTSGGDSNYFISTKFTTGSNPGTLTSISAYVNAIDPSSSNDKFRLAIYADNGASYPSATYPTTLIAQSAEGSLSANTFNTLPVSASLSANTTYWLAYETNGTSIPYNDFSYAPAAPGQYYSYSNPYGSFPSTAGTGGANGALAQAIYGTYTEAGTSTTPALTVTANGSVGIGVTTPSTALQVQGTVSASALSLTGNGTATAFQAGLFDTASAGTLNIGTSNATGITIGSSTATSTVTIGNGTNGGTLINYNSTLNPAAALNNFTSSGAIGTAASTVDIHTSFTINQTSSSITLSIPSPTLTTAGRIIYIANIGSATTTVGGVTMGAGTSASFFWNGTSWISTAVSTGVSLVGTFSSSSIANGASISGNTLTLGVADGTNPGMVSTGAQSFGGAKTFTDVTTVAKTSTTAFQIQNTGGSTTLLTADTSSNRVGIGTAAPGSTIDIKGSTSDSTASSLNVQDSLGASMLNVRNDGKVTIGSVASSGTTTTFGNNTHTTADTNDSLNLSASKFTTGGTPGTLTSVSVWVNGIDPTAANDKYRLAIYSDNGSDQPVNLIAESAEGTLTASSFNTLTVNASLSANTTYWLAYQTNGSNSTYNNFSYASGSTKQLYYKSQSYGVFPSTGPSGGSNGNIAMAIYGTYTLAGTATTPALTVAANGNVGIGNASPAYALDLVGTGNFSTSVYAPSLDTAAAGTLTIAGANATTVNIANNAVAHTINIATGAAQQTVTIGSTNGASATTIQGGTGNVNLYTNSASAGVIVKSGTNSATAFQVQNASGTNLFNVDTSGGNINMGVGAPPAPLGYTSVGGSTGSGYNVKINANKFTATQTGAVSSMSVNIPSPDSAPNNHFQVGIYTDSSGAPATYIASSASTTLTTGWNTVALTTTPTLNSGTTYWLVYWADTDDSTHSGMATDSGVNGASYWLATSTYASGASNGMPTSFPGGAGQGAFQHSIYVTFASASYAITVSSAGNLSATGTASFRNTNDSTAAFQVQTSGGTSVLTADTTNNKVAVSGALSANTATVGTTTASSTLTIQGGTISNQLSAPTLSSTVTVNGTTGSTTYRYQVTALDGTGETTGSTIQQTTSGNASLSTASNTITWTAVPGAYQYNVYRCSGGSCTPLKLATVAGNVTSYIDGATGSPSGSAPGSNTTGGATFAGALQSSSLDTAAAGTLTIAGANATTVNVANNAVAHTINIATGAAAQTVTVGSTNTSSTTTLQGGNGVLLQANGSSVGVTVKSMTNSTAAFKVTNSSDTALFTVDTANGQTTNNANLNVGSASNVSGAGHLFSDSFESGNTKLWDQGTVLSGSSTLAANTTTVHNGKYSMKSVAAGAPSAAHASINGATTTMLRTYINLTSNTGDLGLMEFDSAAGKTFQVYVDSANSNKLSFFDGAATGGAGHVYTTTLAFSTGTWHEVELDLTIGSGTTGSATIYVDGASYVISSIDTGSSNPSSVEMGTPTPDTGTAYFDDLVVDTVRPGDGASVNVGDSLHVSGSSSFSGSAVFQATSSSSSAFQIQNSSGTTLLAANTSANTITMGSAGQFSVDGSGNFTTSGTGAIKTVSATAFSVQDASNNSYFNVNTSTGAITIGNSASGNYISFSASGGFTASGTAQHTRQILLSAEYAGAVLDAASDSTCSAANNGTMTAAYDGTTNFYKWVSNAAAQCYDVVVRVPLPSDFNGWSSNTPLSISTYTTNTSTGLVNVDVKDTANAAVTGCAYAAATPGSTSTWSTTGSNCNMSTGTYAANGSITLRIRMTGAASSDVRIDGIALSYNSKF